MRRIEAIDLKEPSSHHRMKGFRFALLITLALLSSACQRRPSRVVVGVAISQEDHPGVRLAIQEINARGGVRGVPLEAVGLDWKGNQFQASQILALAKRFQQTKDLVAVIGHGDSDSTLSAAAYYNQYHLPQIVTIATNPAITNIGQWTYRLCVSDATQGPALADYAVRKWKQRRIGVFYVNDDYGRGLAESFETRAQKDGAEIVFSMMHHNELEADDKATLTAVLAENKSKPPDLMALFQRMKAAEWTIQTIREEGLTSAILGADDLGQPNFIKSPPRLTEGVRFSQFFFPKPDNEKAQQFLAHYEEVNHKAPGFGDAFAYDAVYLVADAVRANGFSRADVKAYLDQLIINHTAIQGVTGTFALNSDHDAARKLYIVGMHDGQQHLLQTIEAK